MRGTAAGGNANAIPPAGACRQRVAARWDRRKALPRPGAGNQVGAVGAGNGCRRKRERSPARGRLSAAGRNLAARRGRRKALPCPAAGKQVGVAGTGNGCRREREREPARGRMPAAGRNLAARLSRRKALPRPGADNQVRAAGAGEGWLLRSGPWLVAVEAEGAARRWTRRRVLRAPGRVAAGLPARQGGGPAARQAHSGRPSPLVPLAPVRHAVEPARHTAPPIYACRESAAACRGGLQSQARRTRCLRFRPVSPTQGTVRDRVPRQAPAGDGARRYRRCLAASRSPHVRRAQAAAALRPGRAAEAGVVAASASPQYRSSGSTSSDQRTRRAAGRA